MAHIWLPIAWDATDSLVRIPPADPQTPVFCPHCHMSMHWVQEGRHRGFRHDRVGTGPSGGRCRGERAIHTAAQHAAITHLRHQPDRIRLAFPPCAHHSAPVGQSMPSGWSIARAEAPWGRKRVDCGLYTADGTPWGIIEIVHRHALDAADRVYLDPWPWIELEARSLLDDGSWRVQHWGSHWSHPCPQCRTE